jgi:hypothetical protein
MPDRRKVVLMDFCMTWQWSLLINKLDLKHEMFFKMTLDFFYFLFANTYLCTWEFCMHCLCNLMMYKFHNMRLINHDMMFYYLDCIWYCVKLKYWVLCANDSK